MKHYIIYFTAVIGKERIFGCCSTKSETFPSPEHLIPQIQKEKGEECSSVAITSIQKVSKKDMKGFMGRRSYLV